MLRVALSKPIEASNQSLIAYTPTWHPQSKCNKELFSASESCVLAVLITAAFPQAKSVCNAWSDTHWQPAQTFPAWLQRLQRLQRRGEISASSPHPLLVV